jgi:TolA-binding protein
VAAALVAATSFSGSVDAQSGRLSLAERVARLEAQNQGQGAGQSTVDLLNRIDDLQSEVQSLRGLVEQQAFEIEELKKRGRDQYVDLDSRIARSFLPRLSGRCSHGSAAFAERGGPDHQAVGGG